MAQNQQAMPQRPLNIFEVINNNVNVTNQNVLTALGQLSELKQQLQATQQEVIALSLMFKAPEQPKVASGGEDAKTE